jgi:hypothetical protein
VAHPIGSAIHHYGGVRPYCLALAANATIALFGYVVPKLETGESGPGVYSRGRPGRQYRR